jgi:hypothetical protein
MWTWKRWVLVSGVSKCEYYSEPHLSRDPGVTTGFSPTLSAIAFLAFFSKYLWARALSFPAYSFSIALRSR